MNKTELISITKEHLIRYPIYKATLKRKQEQLAELTEKIDGLKGTDYSKDKVSGSVESDSMSFTIETILKLEQIISRLSNLCKDVETAVKALPEPEQTIIRMYYMETPNRNKRTWIAIAYETNYNEKHCRRLRDKAIQRISIIFE